MGVLTVLSHCLEGRALDPAFAREMSSLLNIASVAWRSILKDLPDGNPGLALRERSAVWDVAASGGFLGRDVPQC
jgi:hypothetical protein